MKVKKVHIFYGRRFLLFTKTNPKNRINGLTPGTQEKKTKLETIKNLKNMFFKKSFPHKTILMIVSTVIHRKDIKKPIMKFKKIFFSSKNRFYIK